MLNPEITESYSTSMVSGNLWVYFGLTIRDPTSDSNPEKVLEKNLIKPFNRGKRVRKGVAHLS